MPTVLQSAGAVLVVAGVAMIYPPAAFILAGVLAGLVGWLVDS